MIGNDQSCSTRFTDSTAFEEQVDDWVCLDDADVRGAEAARKAGFAGIASTSCEA